MEFLATSQKRGVRRSSLAVILPVTESSKPDLITREDFRYKYLSGNRPEVTKDTCGKWVYWGCLESHNHGKILIQGQKTLQGSKAKRQDWIKASRLSCGKLDCPVCYEKACGKQAIKISHRIKQFKWSNRKTTKYYHWTLSPSEIDLTKYNVPQLRKKAIKLAKQSGISGGCLIFHHLRKYNETPQNQTWEQGSTWKKAPASWYLSPHFHIIGVGFTPKQKVLHVYEKHGWITKNLGERESVRATALYQLSHAYIPEKGHTVVWFGLMSYNSKTFKPKPVPKEKPLCPECNEELKKVKTVNFEAEHIVITKIEEEGLYHFDSGIFEYCVTNNRNWVGKG